MDCCIPDPKNPETQDALIARAGVLHPEQTFAADFPSRFKKGWTPGSAEVLTTKEPVAIAPANGKLGVLLPGLGAVSTTFIAGVETVKRGLAAPIGSLTQLSTVRLGKRNEGRTPLIKDFVPLAA